MNGRLLFPLGRGLLALAFIGPGGMHLLEGWRAQRMSASAAVALIEVGAGLAVQLDWQVRWIARALAIFLVADEAAGPQSRSLVPPALHEQQPHQRLDAREVDASAAGGVFVIERDVTLGISPEW